MFIGDCRRPEKTWKMAGYAPNGGYDFTILTAGFRDTDTGPRQMRAIVTAGGTGTAIEPAWIPARLVGGRRRND